jgi:hypothetical protein
MDQCEPNTNCQLWRLNSKEFHTGLNQYCEWNFQFYKIMVDMMYEMLRLDALEFDNYELCTSRTSDRRTGFKLFLPNINV